MLNSITHSQTYSTDFLCIPWQNNFLEALLRHIRQETGDDMANVVIVFPHSRPRKYFTELLRSTPDLPKPCLLPQMHSVTEFFSLLRAAAENTVTEEATLLDRVGLLLECMHDLPQQDNALAELPLSDTNRFFPWGIRLASLLEDLFMQNTIPEDYHYMEGQVVPFAAALLAQLSCIHELYTDKLTQRGWTTSGFTAFQTLSLGEKALSPLQDKHIFIAGFYGLTGVEKQLFHTLWKNYGARIVLHTDPALSNGKKIHWACKEHVRWIQEWKATPMLAEDPSPHKQQRIFHEGFDLHSQLDVLEQTLTAQQHKNSLENTAVILPDTGLLMPVLHHLPRKDINISMGYPLGRSTLFRLLETIMRLQERRGEKGYYWKDVIELIRHPYLKMLSINEERPLGSPLHAIESIVRTGRSFTNPQELSFGELGGSTPTASVRTLLNNVFTHTLTRWETLETPQQLADSLGDLCSLLLEHGGDLWERFPIDAESIFRIMQRVIPALRECSLAQEIFPKQVLFTILRQSIQEERVPFEADPLTGLQILGMLESRLLHFSTLHIVDTTENLLPGSPAHDPLLPDTLRTLLGLPDGRHRERVSAYNFYRLLMSAENVHISYQSGVDRSGLFEEKRIRSRFVEELLWEEERKQQKLLTAGDAPLHAISYPIPPLQRLPRYVERTETVDTRIKEYLTRPLSPSALDAYVQCPYRFFHERLCRLTEVDSVNEGDDFAGMGDLLHHVLEDFFTPYLAQHLSPAKLSPEKLTTRFVHFLYESGLRGTIPYDSFLMLETAGKERLTRFLKNQPETTIVSLEQQFHATVPVEGHSRFLAGRIDRIDEREGETIILDYKTGTVKSPVKDVWDNDTLWEKMATWKDDTSTLPAVAEAMRSVQLPAYLYIYPHATSSDVFDAGWVELRDSGKEILLLGKSIDEETRETIITTQIPQLINFLFRHLENSSVFLPQPGHHCTWCTCRNCCSV